MQSPEGFLGFSQGYLRFVGFVAVGTGAAFAITGFFFVFFRFFFVFFSFFLVQPVGTPAGVAGGCCGCSAAEFRDSPMANGPIRWPDCYWYVFLRYLRLTPEKKQNKSNPTRSHARSTMQRTKNFWRLLFQPFQIKRNKKKQNKTGAVGWKRKGTVETFDGSTPFANRIRCGNRVESFPSDAVRLFRRIDFVLPLETDTPISVEIDWPPSRNSQPNNCCANL